MPAHYLRVAQPAENRNWVPEAMSLELAEVRGKHDRAGSRHATRTGTRCATAWLMVVLSGWLSGCREPDLALPPLAMSYLEGSHATPDAKEVELSQGRARQHLLIVFTAGDCYAGLADVPFWNRLGSMLGGSVNVSAVTIGSSVRQARHFVAGQGIEIPVLFDDKERILGALHRAGILTPALILADSSGRTTYVGRVSYGDSLQQRQTVEALREAINRTPRQR